MLENDTDALGEDLPPSAVAQLVADVGNGALALAPDGSFTYTPDAGSSQHRFFGVIDTHGFTTFEIVETEGVVQDQEFIFGDDFTFAVVNAPACGDGVDNDADGFADFPVDPGCLHAIDGVENPQCQDGVNNDPGQDGLIDFDGGASAGLPAGFQTAPDPQCQGDAWRNREARSRRCGLGFELVLILPGLMWLRRRRALR